LVDSRFCKQTPPPLRSVWSMPGSPAGVGDSAGSLVDCAGGFSGSCVSSMRASPEMQA